MKRIIIIILLFSIFLIGCNSISAETIISTTVLTTVLTSAETTIITETTVNNDYNNLKVEYDKLAEDKQKLEDENKAYDYLIRNLNNLLKNVYYGYASNDKYILDGFTAFSIYYKDKYYIITAGHCVKNECGKFGNFKFKANFSNEWIYPKLLTYKNEYNGGKDYTVFISDKITNGFIPNTELTYPAFILGHGDKLDNNEHNIIKLKENSVNFGGESGSPIININGEALGIMTGMMTNIEVVLEAIDNLK